MRGIPKEIQPAETLYWMMQLISNGYSPREARDIVEDAINRYKEDNK